MSGRKPIKELLEKELSLRIDPEGDYPALDNELLTQEERASLTKWDIFVKQLVGKAMRGDAKAQQEVLDRLYGKAPQHITQDVNVNSYTHFLEGLARLEEPEIVEVEVQSLPAPVTKKAPKVEKKASPEDGGSSGRGLLEDFGLLSNE